MVDKLNTLAERLKFLRKKAGLSLAAVGKQVGVSAQAVHKWEAGGKVDGHRDIHLAQLFDVSPSWLIYGDDSADDTPGFPQKIYEKLEKPYRDLRPSIPKPSDEGIFVPLLAHDAVTNWIARAGPFDFHMGEWVACPGEHSDSTYALRVDDSSMENLGEKISYSEGDIIFIDPAVTPWNQSRVILTCKEMDSGLKVIFRQLIIEGWEMYRQPLNKSWPEQRIRIPDHELPAGTIIGKWVKE